MAYNAANRKDVRAAEKAQILVGIVNREVISGLMSIANGRQWVHERLAETFVFADPFHHDPTIHAYNAGLRAQGIKLFNEVILYAPHEFTTMIREAHERAAANDERSSSTSAGRFDQSAGQRDADSEFDPYAEPERITEDA